eukprot:8175882-Pyramimonas_sp.AAC.1
MAPARGAGDNRTWYCWFCAHEKIGARFLNKPDRPPVSPSVNSRVGGGGKKSGAEYDTPWARAAELRQTHAQVAKLEKQLKSAAQRETRLIWTWIPSMLLSSRAMHHMTKAKLELVWQQAD